MNDTFGDSRIATLDGYNGIEWWSTLHLVEGALSVSWRRPTRDEAIIEVEKYAKEHKLSVIWRNK